MIPAHQMAHALKTMPEEQRRVANLMLEVWDGDNRTRGYLEFIAQMPRREEVLRYLLRERLRGKRLFEYAKAECDGSPMWLAATVLMKLNGDDILKRLVVGRDIR